MAKISPVVWQPWIDEAIVAKQNLISMGLVGVQNYNFSGKYFPKPVRNHYEDIGTLNAVIATTTLTPVTYSDYQENAVVRSVGDAIYDTNYDVTTRGDNGLDGIAREIMPVVTNLIQTDLVAVTTGAFGTALASSLYSDQSTVGDGMPTLASIEKTTAGLLGENIAEYDTMIISSNHAAYLNGKYGLMLVNATEAGANITFKGQIQTLGRYKVLINDTLCAASGTDYPIFLAKGQPWQLYWQKNMTVYNDFDALTGGGKNILAWYTHYAPAINGVSWTHTSYDPTAANLATAAYWGLVGNAKNVGLVKILYKGDA